VFFIQYNDPPFIKYEKLALIKKLCNETNFEPVVTELKQYVYDPDATLAREALRMIGDVCVFYPPAYEKFFSYIRCLSVFLDLLTQKKSEYL
jgi:vesicle coat complex subunit